MKPGCSPEFDKAGCIYGRLEKRLGPAVLHELERLPWPSCDDDRLEGMKAGWKCIESTDNILAGQCNSVGGCVDVCHTHGRFHEVHFDEMGPNQIWPRETIVSNGLECIDVSSMGRKAGIGGRSAMNHSVFMHFRKMQVEQETAVVIEEAHLYRTHALRRIYGPDAEEAAGRRWNIQELNLCPSMFGWPMTRIRKWVIITNERRVTMMCTLQEFLHSFFRTLTINADVFWVEEHAIVEAELERRFEARGWSCGQPHWEGTLTPRQLLSLQEYRRMSSQKEMSTRCPGHVFDLEQSPDSFARMSVKSSCMLRHGCFWSEYWSRPLLKAESFSAMGWHCMPQQHGNQYKVPFQH